MSRPRRTIIVTVAVVALAAVGAVWWAPWRAAPEGHADAGDAVQVALGETVYAERCASCHGVQLEGQPDWRTRRPDGKLPAPPHDDSGHSWHHADAQLFGITKFGLGPYAPEGYVSDMPAFKDVLSDADIWAVLAYIKSRWSPENRARQASIDQRARQTR